jgi:MiaB-like tRNA modifying enzyme
MRPKIFFETYGCPYNKADTKIMEKIVSKKFDITEDVERSDIIILNTCYVKTPTENRIVNRIKELARRFPEKKMVVAGCMTIVDKERVLLSNPRASLLGPQNVDRIEEAIEKSLLGERFTFLDHRRVDKSRLPKLWKKNDVIRIVPVCEGCSDNCNYCCTRIARGSIFSFDTESILREISEGVQDGAKEFWLSAQDTSAYGLDKENDLADLINRVAEVDGEFFIRVGMMNANHAIKILEKLIRAYKSPKVFKFLHLPVQSGSDKILGAMRRRYEIREAEKVIEYFRKEFPMITFTTDIIIGYPGETDEDFSKTIEFLKRTRPDVVNLSKFGKRPGTIVNQGKDYDLNKVKERTRIVHDVTSRLQMEGYFRWMGWYGKVLIDEYIGADSVGRNDHYKNVVIKENIPLGTMVDVEVVEAHKHFLLGKVKGVR